MVFVILNAWFNPMYRALCSVLYVLAPPSTSAVVYHIPPHIGEYSILSLEGEEYSIYDRIYGCVYQFVIADIFWPAQASSSSHLAWVIVLVTLTP